MKVNSKTYAQAYLSAAASVPASQRHLVAQNLWKIVWRRGHFKWQKNILASLKELIREKQGVKLAEIATPQPLTESERSHLVNQLTKAIGQPVELVCSIKPHLLSGMIVTIDNRRYDASLKGRLDSLYNTLAGEEKIS